MIKHLVMVPAATMMSGAKARSAPLAIVRVVAPMMPMIVTILSIIISIGPVSGPFISIWPATVTIGSPVVTIRSTIVVSMARVAAIVIRWMSGVVPAMRSGR